MQLSRPSSSFHHHPVCRRPGAAEGGLVGIASGPGLGEVHSTGPGEGRSRPAGEEDIDLGEDRRTKRARRVSERYCALQNGSAVSWGA